MGMFLGFKTLREELFGSRKMKMGKGNKNLDRFTFQGKFFYAPPPPIFRGGGGKHFKNQFRPIFVLQPINKALLGKYISFYITRTDLLQLIWLVLQLKKITSLYSIVFSLMGFTLSLRGPGGGYISSQEIIFRFYRGCIL